ncbi:MAG: DsbA family protein [Patescibacteria group bacterium]|nr:DsbA family protein [Patescibacteria group bacterium]
MPENKKMNILQPVMVVLLVVAAFAIGSMWTQLKMIKSDKGVPTAQPTAQEPGAPEEPTEVSEDVWQEMLKDPAAVKGDKNAKVTMVEFSDYQCPFCKRYAEETMDQIDKEYVMTGKVRYIVRDLPLEFHQFAQKAAEAAKCAGVQGKSFEYSAHLFTNQDSWPKETDVTKTFVGYAATVGLNGTKFSNCLTNGEQAEAVAGDMALAKKAGLGGTPSFVINGKILVGAQPFEAFKAMIEAELK